MRAATDAALDHDATEFTPTPSVDSQPEESDDTADIDTADTYAADTDAAGTHREDSESDEDSEDGQPALARRRINWSRMLAYGVLPCLALLVALGAGFFKWQDSSARDADVARIESVAAAKDSVPVLLSYQPDTAAKTLVAARDRLTGTFKDAYTQLTQDVVIPGAKQQQVSATATVPAAASVSATPTHAVALVFVNQTSVVGSDRPTELASTVRVTLDKVNGRWLISGFDPI